MPPRTKLMNYTTEVAVDKTVGEITSILVRAGARSIQTDFNYDGHISGMSFVVKTNFGNRAFHVPVQSERVQKVLQREVEGMRTHTSKAMLTSPEHAERVAWRILKDWLEAQMTLVTLQLIGLDQAMLGFMVVRQGDNRTAYELYADEQLALPS
jgi:hypothetical protein